MKLFFHVGYCGFASALRADSATSIKPTTRKDKKQRRQVWFSDLQIQLDGGKNTIMNGTSGNVVLGNL